MPFLEREREPASSFSVTSHAPPLTCVKSVPEQVVINLDPAKPELGTVKHPLISMHDAQGCDCETPKLSHLRINHYLGSIGDYMDKNRRYWKVEKEKRGSEGVRSNPRLLSPPPPSL